MKTNEYFIIGGFDMNKTITSHGGRNEELFLAGVEYLSKKV